MTADSGKGGFVCFVHKRRLADSCTFGSSGNDYTVYRHIVRDHIVKGSGLPKWYFSFLAPRFCQPLCAGCDQAIGHVGPWLNHKRSRLDCVVQVDGVKKKKHRLYHWMHHTKWTWVHNNAKQCKVLTKWKDIKAVRTKNHPEAEMRWGFKGIDDDEMQRRYENEREKYANPDYWRLNIKEHKKKTKAERVGDRLKPPRAWTRGEWCDDSEGTTDYSTEEGDQFWWESEHHVSEETKRRRKREAEKSSNDTTSSKHKKKGRRKKEKKDKKTSNRKSKSKKKAKVSSVSVRNGKRKRKETDGEDEDTDSEEEESGRKKVRRNPPRKKRKRG